MEIVLPTKEYIDSYYELVLSSKTNNEYGELGNAAIRDNETFDEMIIRLNNRSKGINIHPRDVKSCVYWIIDNDVVVGTIDMRLELNKNYLEKFGHVAYYIKSDYRNNGYASRALHLILEKYKEIKLDKVLVTCLESNKASEKVILNNGGKLENKVYDNLLDENILRYIINI